MLVLQRYESERIHVGRNIVITVIECRGKQGGVRLGIEAPDDVDVHREEVFERIEAGEPARRARQHRSARSDVA